MAEIANNYSVGNELGCGFMGGIFQKWNHWPRKSHVHSLPCGVKTEPISAQNPNKPLRRRRSNSADPVVPDHSTSVKALQKPDQKISMTNPPRTSSNTLQKVQGKRLSDAARSSTSSSNGSGQNQSGLELSRVVTEQSKALVKASSITSNAIGLGHLGNLKQPGTRNSVSSNSPGSASRALLALSRSVQDSNLVAGKSFYGGGSGTMGNIVRRNSCSDEFRGVSKNIEPEALKRMGNEAYKQGRFREALNLYDKAIALDSNKAVYRSNRSAALTGLGRLIEAVFECKEAIRIEPSYQRAHHRLATLYLRLGEAEKALHHYKHSGSYASSKDLDKSQALQKCLVNCSEAHKLENWSVLEKETKLAISCGANSAPLVFAQQAEALLRLLRHEEAYTAYQKGPNLNIDDCINFFGMTYTAYFLMIGSYVYLAAGRFEDSVKAAQQAVQLDPTNKEASSAVKRARAISSARSNGNILFKAEKFSQACIVYSHGLEHDLHNSVLLCNRAACRSKLGQFEKAIEDCSAALNVQPSYSKARLRRADCNVKLERWEASIQDYEVLIRETPGDEEVGKALFDAQIELKRHRGEDIKDIKFGSNLVFVSSNERFRHIVTSPGMSVVLFCNKDKQKRVCQALEQVCKRFPSVNFLKVEVEDHPYLVKMEGVNNVPAFKIYKNGSKVKEIPGSNHELLESSVKWYSS